MFYDVRNFGAVGDGIHDDWIAFDNALQAMRPTSNMDVAGGGILLVPAGNYFLSKTLRLTHEVQIIGITGRDGKGGYLKFHVDASGRPIFDSLPGGVSRLMFPVGTTGIQVALGGSTVPGIGPREHAAGSILRNLTLVGAELGTLPPPNVFGHGISIKANTLIDNCFIHGFTGNGIHIVALSGPPAESDGTQLIDLKCPELGDLYRDNRYEGDGGNYLANAIDTHVSNTVCRSNGLHGVYVIGSNAGNILFDKVHCLNNERYGFFDSERSAANTYVSCHSQLNGQGGFFCLSSMVIKAADGSLTYAGKTDTGSVYIACYQEQADTAPTRIYGPAHIIGGVLAAEGINHFTPDPDLAIYTSIDTFVVPPPPSMQRQEGRGWAATGFPNGIRSYGGPSADAIDNRVAIEIGSGIPSTALSLLTAANDGVPYRLKYNSTIAPGWWAFSSIDGNAQSPLRLATSQAKWPITGAPSARQDALWLSGGFHLGWLKSSDARPIFMSSAWAPPTDQFWDKGDVVWNLDPTPNEEEANRYKSYAGWVCIEQSLGNPPKWAGFGKLEAL
jgi:Pectate lyase superfamily protein